MHVILNGVNSRTIQGLEITSLPPVSAPPKRTNQILIDGRDGDILEDLGYSAYEKAFTILLHNNYDPNEVIGFFSQSGTAIFSNEPDMVYTYEMVNGIDISKGNFNSVKVATITFHVQPYKLSATEQPATGEVSTLVDKTPYILRRTPYGAREKGSIVGGSIVWNQRTQNGNFESTTGWVGRLSTLSASGNVLTLTPSSDGTSRGFYSNRGANDPLIIAGHKYLLSTEVLSPIASGISLTFQGAAGAASTPQAVANQWTPCATIWTTNVATMRENYYTLVQANLTTSQEVKFRNHMSHDLTLMFGPTIADYIYTQEQATAGAGVALAKAWAGITADYYPYDAGSIKSVTGLTAHRMTGFNQWDEEWEVGGLNASGAVTGQTDRIRSKNLIPVIAGQTYYFKGSYYLCAYDSNGVFINRLSYNGIGGTAGVVDRTVLIPSGVANIKFVVYTSYGTTYNHDICINLSDPSRNGVYEPYTAHTYPLDSSLTLRGLPKLDEDNLYYDGDVYKADGTVERRYGVRAYQSGDESDATVLTDGTNTVYKLTNATTEQAEPYTELQVCDPNGTEEWVGANMPVGHETTYIDPISMTVTNEGNTTSAPSITIEGEGAVEVTVDGLNILQIQMPASGEITIDSKTLDATDGEGGLANRSVTGDYNDLRLAPGEHTVTVTGDVTSVTLKNTSRWI